jgi:hypothetical protein
MLQQSKSQLNYLAVFIRFHHSKRSKLRGNSCQIVT